ncbi:hypothetical protein [Siccirubricoccus sp. G192]|uniref:hypothetical protein n=1 Tax=Siccirubricoccus sp. G192 TaxID=2849651 RepID=UPI001C2BD42D|nr:hypothetical protein [Siccirubricoccus sp. G192]MBV1800138.1 hypothetical protein [Siccirubricoccus sp. G192]
MRLRLPLLLLACGGLGWLALAGEGGPGDLPVPTGFAEAPPPRPASPPPPGPAAGPWPEQVARPLFAATRRPPEPPPEPVPLMLAAPGIAAARGCQRRGAAAGRRGGIAAARG